MANYNTLLKRKDFVFFLATQFLGSFNDNFYRMIVSLLLVFGAFSGEPLSIAAMIFIFPYIIFSGYAGFFADRFSKRSVMIVIRILGFVAMVFAFVAFYQNRTDLMLLILFVIATEATFFSPAKYGILPEIVSTEEISYANGLLQSTNYIAILLGGVFGGVIVHFWEHTPAKIGLSLVFVSALGILTSFGIKKVVATSSRKLALNPWSEIYKGCQQFREHPLLFWVTIAIAYFWALGLTLQVNLVSWGHFTLNWDPVQIACMQVALGIGIGLGSILAGKMSGDQIEPGLIPLGAVLMALWLFILPEANSVWMIFTALLMLGIAAGFYIVPLNALLQELPERDEKGRIIATANFVSALAMLIAALSSWVAYTHLELSPSHILLFLAGFTLLLAILAIKIFPDFFLRFLIWLVTHTLYRIRIIGDTHIPKTGPALLVCNHVSYMDGLILSGSIPRFIRYLIFKDFYDNKLLNWLFRLAHAIPIKEGEYEMVLAAFENAREQLRQGHVVCIFAEGTITRTGQLLPFRKGFERILEGLDDVPIIPVYLDALWNSIFAFRGGKVFWKLPREIPIRVTISFGAPMSTRSKAQEVRLAVQELGAAVKFSTKHKKDTLSRRLVHMARERYFRFCMADIHTPRLTYGEFVGEALLLARYFRNQYAGLSYIGVWMPQGVKSALINAAITLSGKIAINFTYGDIPCDRNYFIEKSQVKVIISSRRFLQEFHENPLPYMVYFEDFNWAVHKTQKMIARWAALWLPINTVLKWYGDHTATTDNTAVVSFTRGRHVSSQGVLLSHCSIIANVTSFSSVLHLKQKDRVMGVLPFYTAYGYSLNLWLPLLNGMGIAYHPQPATEPAIVGRMMGQFKTSVIFDEIAHYKLYLEDIRPSHFSYIHYAVVAGESLSDALAEAFVERFGLELLDSYGCTEMGPGIATNVPDVRHPGRMQRGTKPGSVGHPLPGVAVKIVDPTTYKTLENGKVGLLLVRGLGLMQGYMNESHLTQTVFHEGWYITGDLCFLDNDGFLFFKGRL